MISGSSLCVGYEVIDVKELKFFLVFNFVCGKWCCSLFFSFPLGASSVVLFGFCYLFLFCLYIYIFLFIYYLFYLFVFVLFFSQ